MENVGMKESNNALRNRYPDYLSLDELRKVCKISPRSARYLIENGVIPAIDTGKITWRYKIAIDDVITYLQHREKHGSMIPPGAVTSRYKTRKSNGMGNRKTFSELVRPGEERIIAEYFRFVYAEWEEVLTTVDIAEMTGLRRGTILKLAKSGHIKSIESSPRYLIPKAYLMEFVVTPRFIEAKSNSEEFKKILGGFEIWKTAKSSL
jgi:excisionase family DNA binding protein